MNATTLKYLIMAVFIGLGIFAVLVWAGIVPGLGGGGNTGTATIKRAELTVWGTADDKAQFDAMVEAFRGPNPGVKITYEKKSPEGYEDELVRAFAAGKGPDLFALHNTWLVKYGDLLAPASKELVSPAGLKGTLADVALRDFAAGDALYGLPLAIDTLALYYNTELFNSAGIVFPPKDWDEFVKDSRLLTKRKPNGEVAISGAAMGAGNNIPYAPDHLALLMLQYGASIFDASGKVNFGAAGGSGASLSPAEAALDFYTSFAKPSPPRKTSLPGQSSRAGSCSCSDTPERAPSCLKNLRASSSPWPPCRKSKERLSIRIMPIIGDTACIKIQRTRSWRGNF